MDIAVAYPIRPSPAIASLVEVRDLHLTVPAAAGPVNILAGVDLDVAAGESTVTVAGQELTGLDEDALARFRRDNVGIVFQAFHLIPTMTALENVSVPLELAGLRDANERAAESLASVGLGHRLTHLPGQLSGGEQQRVALARAFAPRPRLLLADEPTGNLDVATGRSVMDLLFGMQERFGTTLLLITHDPALADRCSRRVRIADGRVAVEATA